MIYLSLLLGTLTYLAFPSTRILGVLGGMYLHPLLTIGLLLFIGAAFYYFKEYSQ